MRECLILCSFLAACSPIDLPDCITSGGVLVYEKASCDELSAFETALRKYLPPELPWNAQGWVFRFRAENWFSEELGFRVRGLTHCHTGWSEVSLTSERETYLHELMHVLERCYFPGEWDDPHHPGWVERGIWSIQLKAIEELNGAAR